MRKKADANYEYDRMSREQLIDHCRMYSKALHDLREEMQKHVKKHSPIRIEFMWGRSE